MIVARHDELCWQSPWICLEMSLPVRLMRFKMSNNSLANRMSFSLSFAEFKSALRSTPFWPSSTAESELRSRHRGQVFQPSCDFLYNL